MQLSRTHCTHGIVRPRSSTRLLVRAAAAADSKRAAAEAAVDKYVTSNSAVAFGNGELVNQAIAYLGACLMHKKLENVVAVPVSSAAAHEAAYHGVPLTTVEDAKQVSLLLEQADQYDESANAALKGIRAEPQQPELPRLRQALGSVQKVVLLAESQDIVPQLCASLPVFIDGSQWEEPAEALDDLFLGDAEIWRRPASGVANPRGGDNPYMSPDGHNIVDVRFYEGMKLFGEDAKYDQIAQEIEQIEGVVTHGLLLGVADAVVVADPQQGVRVLEHKAAAAPSS
ncbi:ribose-5 phosphate isomerase-related protein [Scenedesmus sp. NREL 46B-D3]|nr:ribose-5 phosphate isomerase-related protein [Scenedesmus sp. NREL 46B-D3]